MFSAILAAASEINSQEKTKAEVIKSLKIGAEDMLATEIRFDSDAFMTTITVEDPDWTAQSDH